MDWIELAECTEGVGCAVIDGIEVAEGTDRWDVLLWTGSS